MARAVYFDGEHQFMAIEVNNIVEHGDLSMKLNTVTSIRFSNLEIKKEIFSVEMVIQEKVKELLGTAITPPLPPSRGEFMD